jgi:uncharacterized membrane protein
MNQPGRRLFPRWPSFVVLLLAAGYLTLRWNSIPLRWVIHWGPRGEPNGWATRSIAGVYGLLALAAGFLVVNEVATAIRQRGSEVASEMPRAATFDFVRIVLLGFTVMVAMLAIDLPLGPRLPVPALLLLCAAPVILSLVGGAIRLAASLRHLRASGHRAKLEGYHALHYANSNDSRLWVPKLNGMGWTINFSHPLAWPVFLLLLAVPIALVVLSATAR